MKNLEKRKAELRKEIVFSADEQFLDIVDTIKDHVKIDKKKGPFLVSDASQKLPHPHKLLLYLLSLRAGRYLDVLSEDSAETAQISTQTNIPPNVASVRLSELANKNLIENLTGVRGKTARYRMTDYGVAHSTRDVLPRIERTTGTARSVNRSRRSP